MNEASRRASQRRIAISHAGTVAYNQVNSDLSLGITGTTYEQAARDYVASADPHSIRGLFDWSFEHEDIPEIAEWARKLETQVDGPPGPAIDHSA